MQQKCDILPYGNWILPHFDPKISSLGLLEAKIIPKWRTTGSYCHDCYFCSCGGVWVVDGGALLVGGGSACGDWGVLATFLCYRNPCWSLFSLYIDFFFKCKLRGWPPPPFGKSLNFGFFLHHSLSVAPNVAGFLWCTNLDNQGSGYNQAVSAKVTQCFKHLKK